MSSRFFISIFLLCSFNQIVNAQTLTSNPYSYYGIGFLEKNGYCENQGMGSAGIALPSDEYLNSSNPASYSAIDSLAFYLYLGLYGKFSKFEYKDLTQKTFDSNIKYFALGFRASKRWGSSIGLAPFSTRGYFVTTNYPVEGDMSEFMISSTGSGNISKFYFSNSFRITKQVSIGANISYLFGSLKNLEEITYSDTTFNNISNTTSNQFSNIYFDFGLQYKIKIASNNYYAGLTYSPEQSLKTSLNKLIMNSSDTLYYKNEGTENFVLPSSLGFGLGMNYEDKFKLLVDYKIQNWSNSESSYQTARLSNSWQINTGAEYVHNKISGGKYWEYIKLRAGFRFEKTNMTIKSENLNEIAITAGLSFPFRSRTVINIAYEYATIDTKSSNSIVEKYHRITLGFTLKDTWFQKKRFY
jgi:hypothetical protein